MAGDLARELVAKPDKAPGIGILGSELGPDSAKVAVINERKVGALTEWSFGYAGGGWDVNKDVLYLSDGTRQKDLIGWTTGAEGDIGLSLVASMSVNAEGEITERPQNILFVSEALAKKSVLQNRNY